MSTPSGLQLIGETEKTLNPLLRRFLQGAGLTEPESMNSSGGVSLDW